MNMINYDINKLIEDWFANDYSQNWTTGTKTTTYVPNKFAVEVKDDIAIMALSVLGHNPEDIEINCFEDKIEIKAKKSQEDIENPFNQLISDIEERITIGKNYDGRQAKAEVKNGILKITLEKKEESKPKKLTLKVG
jgi:HSP20 family protein